MRLINKPIFYALCLAGLVGCTHDTNLFNGNPEEPEIPSPLKPASEYFDFNTTKTVNFNVNYGKQGNSALIEISIEDPTTLDDDGRIIYLDNAVYKVFCDNNGCFKGNVTLPAATEKVYIYTMRAGLPQLLTVEVENGSVNMDFSKITSSGTRSANGMTRSGNGYQIWDAPAVAGVGKLKSIVNWEGQRFAKITDDQGLISDGDFTSGDIEKIQYFLWGGKTTKPNGLNNTKYLTQTKDVNTIIAPEYKNEHGEIVTVEGAEIWLTFLSEAAWYQDGIGYYYYPTNHPPKSINELTRYIAVPNVSVAGAVPFMANIVNGEEQEGSYKVPGTNSTVYNYKYSDAPFTPNKRIQLLFHNEETGETSTTFPPGYTIGYFLTYMVSGKSNDSNPAGTEMKINNNFFYSNNELNSNGKSHFIALNYKDKIVYGVEDGTDNSLEDVLFCIETNPCGLIHNEERPSIDVEDFTVTESTYSTYAYEDIWPSGGDYDLNDVVIEHLHAVTFNQQNYVTKIEDSFTPVQKADAATYKDAFAIQIPESQVGNLTLPEGAFKENETNSIFLLTNVMGARNKTFTVTRSFSGNQLAKGNIITDLNPFIVSQYDKVGENGGRDEIHLPKHSATSKANSAKIGSADDAYYINKDGKHPFAISLPIGVLSGSGARFTIVTEKENISTEYLRFDNWVETNGSQDADWYLHYK